MQPGEYTLDQVSQREFVFPEREETLATTLSDMAGAINGARHRRTTPFHMPPKA